jgi:hypothetical protein
VTEPRWHRHPHLLWRRSLDAVLVLPPGLDEPLALVGTGPELWALLADPRTTEDLVAVLAAAHESGPEVVAPDVVATLEQLERLGVVGRVAG